MARHACSETWIWVKDSRFSPCMSCFALLSTVVEPAIKPKDKRESARAALWSLKLLTVTLACFCKNQARLYSFHPICADINRTTTSITNDEFLTWFLRSKWAIRDQAKFLDCSLALTWIQLPEDGLWAQKFTLASASLTKAIVWALSGATIPASIQALRRTSCCGSSQPLGTAADRTSQVRILVYSSVRCHNSTY